MSIQNSYVCALYLNSDSRSRPRAQWRRRHASSARRDARRRRCLLHVYSGLHHRHLHTAGLTATPQIVLTNDTRQETNSPSLRERVSNATDSLWRRGKKTIRLQGGIPRRTGGEILGARRRLMAAAARRGGGERAANGGRESGRPRSDRPPRSPRSPSLRGPVRNRLCNS